MQVAKVARSLFDGLFGTLGDDLTLEILRRLPLRDQLLCATTICSSWRKTFRNHPLLFNKLDFIVKKTEGIVRLFQNSFLLVLVVLSIRLNLVIMDAYKQMKHGKRKMHGYCVCWLQWVNDNLLPV